jgi:hypothetical protein
MRARWYDPSSGRFLSRDIATALPGVPGSLNAFGYASGSPIVRSDPSGLCTDPGGSGIRYCINAFIPQGTVNFGFATDDRVGPKADGGTYRFELRIRRNDDGSVAFDARPGTSIFDFGPFHAEASALMGQCSASGQGSTIEASCLAKDGIGWGLAPEVGFNLLIGESGEDAVVLGGDASSFPSLEVWRYQDGRGPQQVLFAPASGTIFGFHDRSFRPGLGGGGNW